MMTNDSSEFPPNQLHYKYNSQCKGHDV